MKKLHKTAITGLALGAGVLAGVTMAPVAFGHGDAPHDTKPAEHKPKAQQAKIVIDGGYKPHQVTVHHGRLVRLTFVRQEKTGCGDVVRFPDLKETVDGKEVVVQRTLKHGEHATIEFTPKDKGTLHFTCGMEMYKGTVFVK